jgi:hypothetical protein
MVNYEKLSEVTNVVRFFLELVKYIKGGFLTVIYKQKKNVPIDIK